MITSSAYGAADMKEKFAVNYFNVFTRAIETNLELFGTYDKAIDHL
jgi:hypothetical protein